METGSSTNGSFGFASFSSGNDALTMVAAEGICDLRRDVAKSEADIKEALGEGFRDTEKSIGDAECAILTKVGDAECSILKNAADVAHRNSMHLAAMERDLQNRIHENRSVLTTLISDKTDKIKEQAYAFERSISEKLCDIKADAKDNARLILDRLSADKLDEKNEIIESLRHDKSQDRFAYQLGLQNQQLDYLKQSINSVEQNQRFSSKTVQFGAGNVAIPTQTANQG